MAYSAVPSVSTGDLWTAANQNTYLRDNFSDHETRVLAAEASITTLAANGYHLIEKQTLTETSVAISFSSIPDTYESIEMICVAKTSGNYISELVQSRCNDDAGNNYSTQILANSGTSVSTAKSGVVSAMDVGFVMGANATQTSRFGILKIIIPGYKNTSAFKLLDTISSLCYLETSDSSNVWDVRRSSCVWLSTTAINKISIYPGASGGFVAGSVFSLYGIV
jgi:hypothetical protein